MEFDTCGHCGAALRKDARYCRFCWYAKCAVCSEWIEAEEVQAHLSGLHPETEKMKRRTQKSRKCEGNSAQTSMW